MEVVHRTFIMQEHRGRNTRSNVAVYCTGSVARPRRSAQYHLYEYSASVQFQHARVYSTTGQHLVTYCLEQLCSALQLCACAHLHS